MAEQHNKRGKSRADSPHLAAQMKEASIGAFEDGQPPALIGEFASARSVKDPEAVQAPGGDSRPDQTNPARAEFVNLADDPRMTTTREPSELPKIERSSAEQYASRRSDDNLEIVATPGGPNDEEIAELRPNRSHESKVTGDT